MPWGNPNPPAQPTWNPSDPAYVPLLDDPAWLAERDRLLAIWEAAKTAQVAATEAEMVARKASQLFAFGTGAREGMNNQPLANGFELKFGNKLTYNITATNAAVEVAEEEASTVGNEGQFLFERIITWETKFSKTEYNKLVPEMATHARIKGIVDALLEIKQATGSLEIKAPKGTRT